MAVADRVVCAAGRPPSDRPAGRFFHAAFRDPRTGCVIDDGLVLVFRGPRSYTGEDAVEFHGHGGTVAPRRLLEAVLAAGAVPAPPGEFTRRAFLNGRLDLTQAEAVLDLIQARTERAAAAAHAQLEGALGRRVTGLYEQLAQLGGDIEAVLDFDESDLPETLVPDAARRLREVRAGIARLAATWHEGHLLRDGALVVIGGAPNVGKSSLLNALLGRPRAIVHAAPGTTRDSIEEGLSLDGIPLRLVDTAGLRESDCAVEREGVDRALALIGSADACLIVLDATLPLAGQAAALRAVPPPGRTLWVVNRIDRLAAPPDLAPLAGGPAVAVSALTGAGLDGLRAALRALLGTSPAGAVEVGVATRHRDELEQATRQLDDAATALGHGPAGLVPAAEGLRQAAEALGRITGRVYTDDLMDSLFQRFCVGK
jgi:tRNA modification GTPase